MQLSAVKLPAICETSKYSKALHELLVIQKNDTSGLTDERTPDARAMKKHLFLRLCCLADVYGAPLVPLQKIFLSGGHQIKIYSALWYQRGSVDVASSGVARIWR